MFDTFDLIWFCFRFKSTGYRKNCPMIWQIQELLSRINPNQLKLHSWTTQTRPDNTKYKSNSFWVNQLVVWPWQGWGILRLDSDNDKLTFSNIIVQAVLSHLFLYWKNYGILGKWRRECHAIYYVKQFLIMIFQLRKREIWSALFD